MQSLAVEQGGEIRCIMGDVQVANVKFALLLEKKKEESPYILNKWMKSLGWEDNRRALLQYILTCEQ